MLDYYHAVRVDLWGGKSCHFCGRSLVHPSTRPLERGLKVKRPIAGRANCREQGCRNLRRLGVREKTIMKIGGWRTRSVFDRYNIVDEKDPAEAAALLDEKA